jgi:threonine/homoserine/homoserine lactone efflux protein
MGVHLIGIFLTVVVAHFLALLSPGPDFVLVVKSAVKNRKNQAIGVALGIAAANAFYISLCLVGVGSILASSAVVMTVLKVAGGLYLSWLAIMALKARKKDYVFAEAPAAGAREQGQTSLFREFVVGFTSSILNPKLPLFYLSLFTLVLNNEVGMWFKIALGLWMSGLVFVWDAFIIFILSRRRVRQVFTGIAFYIDKVTGTILGLIGVKILSTVILDEGK